MRIYSYFILYCLCRESTSVKMKSRYWNCGMRHFHDYIYKCVKVLCDVACKEFRLNLHSTFDLQSLEQKC